MAQRQSVAVERIEGVTRHARTGDAPRILTTVQMCGKEHRSNGEAEIGAWFRFCRNRETPRAFLRATGFQLALTLMRLTSLLMSQRNRLHPDQPLMQPKHKQHIHTQPNDDEDHV